MMNKKEMKAIYDNFFGEALSKADKAIAEYEAEMTKQKEEKERKTEELFKRWNFDGDDFERNLEAISKSLDK